MKFLNLSFGIPYLIIDSDSTIIGGAAVQWKSWIRGFVDNGHQFGILTFKGAKDLINVKTDFDIVECYDPTYGISRIRVPFYQIPKMFFAIKKYKPDYIIQGAATSHTGFLMMISKILNIPFIHRVANDPDVDDRINKMVHKREIFWYKLGVRYSDFISVQNSYQYQRLSERYPNKRIFKIPNPFEVVTTRNEILPKWQRNYIAWVGNFRFMKNLPMLLKIIKEFPKVKFKIAGTKHNTVDKETELAINELERLENVTFVGYLKRAEIFPFFSKAIALLNTSHFEGFSNTFLEAWSCGVPVLSTINANPDNIISKYKLGKIANEYSGLVECIEEIIALDDTQYEALSQTCYNYVKEYHDPKKLAAQFVDYLKNN